MKLAYRLTIAAALAAVGGTVAAHDPGTGLENGFWSAILHPLTGLDHLVMLCLLGLWLRFSRAGWTMALPLLASLAAGALISFGLLPVAATEGLVLASLAVATAAVVARKSGWATVALLSAAMFFHGQAHLHDAGAVGLSVAMVAGLTTGSAIGLAIARLVSGMVIDRLASRRKSHRALR